VTLVVNGRFLRSPRPTGMHRVARALVDHALARGLAAEVLAPPGVEDPRVDRTVWAPRGRFGDHVWEQVSLPLAARGRPVLSLLNTAPVAAASAATMVHDLGFKVRPQWYSAGVRLYGSVVLAAARRARVVIVPSNVIAGELAEIGLAPGRVAVVRPAADGRWRPQPQAAIEAVRRRFALERPYCLIVGWQHPRKDVGTVIEAHRRVVRDVPHDLVLAGTGSPTFGEVRLPDEPSLRVLGYPSDGELVALMSGAAAFAFPSLYEGFGIPVVEALRCGTPTLASDLPVLREASGGAAHFVACGDVEAWAAAIRSALDGEIPAQAPPSWSWDDAAGALLSALEPLL
jgi:glycosyltransferase involved in cell wall biosynthesis